MLSSLLVGVMALAGVPPFLAVSQPSQRGILVVEGWLPEKSLADSVQWFHRGGYEYLVLVTGPTTQAGAIRCQRFSHAGRVIGKTGDLDVAPHQLVTVVADPSRNRTFATAIALKKWLQRTQPTARSVDVFTAGVHARKSWILFRYVLGDNYKVGVIAGPEHSYDARFWFVSPRGIWIVSRNTAGYLYSELAIQLDAHGWKLLSAN